MQPIRVALMGVAAPVWSSAADTAGPIEPVVEEFEDASIGSESGQVANNKPAVEAVVVAVLGPKLTVDCVRSQQESHSFGYRVYHSFLFGHFEV